MQLGDHPGIEQVEEEAGVILDRGPFLRQEGGRGVSRIDEREGAPIPQECGIDSKRRVHFWQGAAQTFRQASRQEMRMGAGLLRIEIEANAPMLNEWRRVQVRVQQA